MKRVKSKENDFINFLTHIGLETENFTAMPSLHKSESAWQRIDKKAIDVEDRRQKEIKSILNKLTPDNFDRLSGKLLEIDLRSVDTLDGLIAQVTSWITDRWVHSFKWI